MKNITLQRGKERDIFFLTSFSGKRNKYTKHKGNKNKRIEEECK